jgi:hypothetical protein
MTGHAPWSDRIFAALVVLSITLMGASFAAVVPLALLCSIAAVGTLRYGTRWSRLAVATAVLVISWTVNVAVMVPPHRLFTFSYWRWHGRALLAPLAMLVLLISPLRVPAVVIRRGIFGLLGLLALLALWGRLAGGGILLPHAIAMGRAQLTVVERFGNSDWFIGLFRHHEVAGGVYALGALYALADLLIPRRDHPSRLLLPGLLFAACLMGLVLTLARAYWAGFLFGAAILEGLALWKSPPAERRALLRRGLVALVLVIATASITPGVAARIGMHGLGSDDAAEDTAERGDLSVRRDDRREKLFPDDSEQRRKVELMELFAVDETDPQVDPNEPVTVELAQYVQSLPGPQRTWWDRQVLWLAAWRGIKVRPLVGYGIGMFPVHYRGHELMYSRSNPEHHVHNNLLQILVDTGVVGLVPLAAWVAMLSVALLRSARVDEALALGGLAAIGCLVVGGVFDTNLYAPTLMLPAVIPATLFLRSADEA